ncbi:MAG: MATE family efflux transporter [Eubacteriales bacterium]|nr:MATE family efflux transporter [Eubacteriales bacterium]
MKDIRLSDHFTCRRLLRFTLPSVLMMIFTSVYIIVDGFFVSNFVGKTPFAAVNFIMPFLIMLGALGFMFGTGGSALIAITLGEGDKARAQRLFSLFVYVTAVCGVVLAVLGIALLRPIAAWLGAEGDLLEQCVLYGRIILIALPAYMLQYEFQSFFVAAEKPQLGLAFTVASGLTNIVLDMLFVGVWRGGLAGAAAASVISQAVGGLGPVVYFARPNSSLMRLTSARLDMRALGKACANGSSELMSNVSASIVGMLYNAQLMRFAGEDGVAAYGVLMYVNMIFMAAFIGYSVGAAPIVGYHYGAGNQQELKSLLRKSLGIIILCSLAMCALAEGTGGFLAALFVGYDPELLALTRRGFLIYSFSFLFAGIPIYGSSFFTALNNGGVSAFIAFLRTCLFQVAAVLILPIFWGIDGVWFSIVAAELLAMAVTVLCLGKYRARYQY